MEILELNWGWFLLAVAAIGATRLVFTRFLPLKLFSIATAATIGFVLFLLFPVLGFSTALAISVQEYSGYVWLAYASFMTGAALARRLFGENPRPDVPASLDGRLLNFAWVFCISWTAVLVLEFFRAGGFDHMRDVIFGGWAHLEVLAEIGELMQRNQGLNFLQIGRILLGNIFICLWVLLFTRMPKRALVLWAVYILTNLDRYISRSTLLGLLLIPFFAYLLFNRPPLRRAALLAGALFIASLVFFSWNSSVRLGLNYRMSTDQIISDTMRDAGNSAIPATMIFSRNLRGDTDNYFLAIATFMIPRSIWHEKPKEEYNYEMTYQLTGLMIGQGTSVKTSTMLGEAWYYFGRSGAIWLMLMFGFAAYSYEKALTANVYVIGLYFKIFYLTITYVRSTFLTYYQTGIQAVLTALLILGAIKLLSLDRREARRPSNSVRLTREAANP
jgi:hypothetical protein